MPNFASALSTLVLCVVTSARRIANLWQIPQNRNMKVSFTIFASLMLCVAIVCAQEAGRGVGPDAGLGIQGLEQAGQGERVESGGKPEAGSQNTALAIPNSGAGQGGAAQVGGNPAAAVIAATDTGQRDQAQELFQKVVAAFRAQQSMAARIHFHAELFGQQIDGKGIYLQQGEGRQRLFRLELQTVIGQDANGALMATLVQVCDGKYLWEYREWPDKHDTDKPVRPMVNRLDLERVRQALGQGERHLPPDEVNEYAFGGLPKFMNGLQSAFQYTRAADDHLDFNNPQTNQTAAFPVWAIHGQWRDDALRPFFPGLADQAAAGQRLDLGRLPTQAPEEVRLFVGQDDLFPYRIEFLRRPTKQGRGAVQDVNVEPRPILTVNFFGVQLGTGIDSQQFVYQPGSADISDITAGTIRGLTGTPPTAASR